MHKSCFLQCLPYKTGKVATKFDFLSFLFFAFLRIENLSYKASNVATYQNIVLQNGKVVMQ